MTGWALALLLIGSTLPLWSMTLHAPQYPGGLRLTVDGRGMRGDLDELNALNHYIGMRPIHPGEIPEVRLFYPAVGLLALGLLVDAAVSWRILRVVVAVGLWALPVVFLADLQWHLYVFGHSLAPQAPFRLPAFTPKAIGPTVVMNFHVTAWPGLGLMALLLAACAYTCGGLARRRRSRLQPVAAVAATLGLVLGTASIGQADGRNFDLAAAVATAPPGAVVVVPPGTYRGPVVLSRPIILRGIGFPVIDGGGQGDVVVIVGDDVHLEGFVVRGSALAMSREAAGIVVRGARAVVRNVQIDDVLFGIYLAGARDTLLEGNRIRTADLPLERRGHALYLWQAQRTHIRGNQILRGKDGIYLSFSHDNVIEDNQVAGSRYGIHYMYAHRNVFRRNVFLGNMVGAAVMYSTDVLLESNVFEGSRTSAVAAGLIFKDADRVTVRGNRILRNRIGLEIENTPASFGGWAKIEHNLIAFNDVAFSLMSTAAITATGNAVVENLRTVQSRGRVRVEANRWTADRRGNYWSDYTGFDADGDGVGDIAYRRSDVLEGLVDRAPPLQAFLFTPAHLALEVASRLLPLVRAEPVVVDRAPLMRSPVIPAAGTTHAAAAAADPMALVWVGVGLLVPALAGLATLCAKRRYA